MTSVAQLRPTAGDTPLAAIAALCKAAGDPLRAQILRVLARDAYSVAELCQVFDIRQPALSHHLKVLAQAGLVATRREGTFVFYRRAPRQDDSLDALRAQLCATLDGSALPAAVTARVGAVQAARAETSHAFFRRRADAFREHQDLIAGHGQYGDTIVQLLDAVRRPQDASVIEVGPGEGELLAELAPRFPRVIALDNAPAMLARAREFAKAHRLANVEFVAGDTAEGLRRGLRAPLITLNMVLHHNASPARMFEDLAAMLEPGGSLLVTELCAHDQDWARSACGDLWLGFEAEELTAWALAAGLVPGDSQFLALRNGFRIQIRQFLRPAGAASSPSTP
ncbi:MAG: metalloregulator ArsR/SmtB family transcription factor [Pseudomonadales bacterium]|nr:metalloregulator ArsR/SmtB family transcription factor [Pseudomonadales bacterium]